MSWGNDPIVESASSDASPSAGWGQSDPVVKEGTGGEGVSIPTRTGMALNRSITELAGLPATAATALGRISGAALDATLSPQARALRQRAYAETGGNLSGSESLQKSLTSVGVPTDPGKPATTLAEHIAEGVGSSVGSMVVPGLGAEALLARTGQEAASFGNMLLNIIKGGGAASNAVIGATSGAGGEVAAHYAPEPYKDVARLGGGLAGGVGGALAESAVRGTGNVLKNAATTVFQSPETAAAKKVLGAAANPEKLRADLADLEPSVPGSNPTLFQATGDTGVGALERKVVTKEPGPYAEVRQEQNTARLDALNRIADPNADTGSVGAFIRQRLDNIEADYGAKVAEARQQAEARLGQAGGSQFDNPADYGGGLQRQLDTLDRQRKAAEDKLWADFREVAGDKPIAIGDFRKSVAEIEGSIGPMAKRPKGEEAEILATIRAAGDFASFKDIGDLRSQITDALRNPQDLTGTQRRRLSQVLGALDETMDAEVARVVGERPGVTITGGSPTEAATMAPGVAAPGSLTAEDVALYGRARAATRERKETFGSGPVGDVLEPGDRSGVFGLTQSSVPAKLLQKPENLRAFVNAAGDSPEAMTLAQDALAFDMRKTAVTKDGLLSPQKLQDWQAKNAEAMRQFPDLQAKFNNARTAQETLDTAIANQKAAMDQFQTDAAKKFLGDRDPHVALEEAMRTPESFRALVATVKEDPAAFAGLKRLTAELILRKGGVMAEGGMLTGAKEAVTSGDPQIAANALQKFFLNKKNLLGEIFDKNELANIEAVTADLQRSARSETAVKNPGGSNTAQDRESSIRDFGRMLWHRFAGAAAGGSAGLSTGDPINAMVGAAVGGAADAWRTFYAGRVDRALTDIMLDARKAAIAFPKIGQTAPSEATMARRMRALLGHEAEQAMEMETRQ